MRTLKLLSTASIAIALSVAAQAQFSVSGGGSPVPASGVGGGMWTTGLPVAPGTATATVPEAVTAINSVVILGFSHDWGGDVHATLADPDGVEYNLFLRPGFMNPVGADFGTPGEFLLGDYTIVQSGGADLPTISDGVDIPAGTYNQTFNTGGVTWPDGEPNGALGIFNVPLGSITGPAGDWELRIYDWGVGDAGSFTGWTLVGNQTGPTDNSGASDCDCTGTNSPCGNVSGADRGCPNSNLNGLGAMLVGTGHAAIASDTFQLSVVDAAPEKPGLIFAGSLSLGPNGLNVVPNNAGLLCIGGSTLRGEVVFTDVNGSAAFPSFQGQPFGLSTVVTAGSPVSYSYWFRDPGTAAGCANDNSGADFNFSNGWTVTGMN